MQKICVYFLSHYVRENISVFCRYKFVAILLLRLFHAGYLPSFLFKPEDGGSTFFRNVGEFLTGNTTQKIVAYSWENLYLPEIDLWFMFSSKFSQWWLWRVVSLDYNVIYSGESQLASRRYDRFHLQSMAMSRARNQHETLQRWRRYIPPRPRLTFTLPRDVMYPREQKSS
jgi:hypothetical protein